MAEQLSLILLNNVRFMLHALDFYCKKSSKSTFKFSSFGEVCQLYTNKTDVKVILERSRAWMGWLLKNISVITKVFVSKISLYVQV